MYDDDLTEARVDAEENGGHDDADETECLVET